MRSGVLLIANIFATIYAAILLFIFGGAVIQAGGADFVSVVNLYFKTAFQLFGTSEPGLNLVYAIIILLCVHVAAFSLGCVIGWIAYAAKKSGGAKFAAVLYLIGTICFPVYIIFGLPITVLGFIGGGSQKKYNQRNIARG